MTLRITHPAEFRDVLNQPPDTNAEANVSGVPGARTGILCHCNGETKPGDFNFGTLFLRLSPCDEVFSNEQVIESPTVVLTAREIYSNNPVNRPMPWSADGNKKLQASIRRDSDELPNSLFAVQQLWRPVPGYPGRVETKQTSHLVRFYGRRVEHCSNLNQVSRRSTLDLKPELDLETEVETEDQRGALTYVFAPSGNYDGVRLVGKDGNALRANRIQIVIKKCGWECQAGDDSSNWGVPVSVVVQSPEGVGISPWRSSCARFPELSPYSLVVYQDGFNSTVVKDCGHRGMTLSLKESDIFLNVNFMLLFNLKFAGEIIMRVRVHDSFNK